MKQLIRILFIFLPLPIMAALPEDFNQPIEVLAIGQEADLVKNTVIFTEDVEVTQGSIKVYADKVIVYRNAEGRLSKVEAFGKPVRYSQMLDNEKITGEANYVIYGIAEKGLRLSENAFVTYGGNNTLKGSEIFYNMISRRVSAKNMKKSGKKDRVKSVFEPANF